MITPEFFRLSQLLNPFMSGFQQDSPEQDYDPIGRMNQMYTPDNKASNNLMDLITNMPQREEPGIGRKVLASIAGLTGDPNRVENMLYQPYLRELEDWNARVGPSIQAANFERQGNVNERMLANQIVSQEQRDRTLERQIGRDKTLEKQGQARIDQSEKRIKQADTRLEIAEATAKGGTIDWGSNQIVYKDGTVKKIDADLFTAQEKEALKQKYALERIETQGEQTRKTKEEASDASDWQIVPQYNAQGLPIGSLRVNRVTGKAIPITLGEEETPVVTKTETQSNKDRRITAEALRVKAQDPKLSKYIQIKSGRFEGIQRPNRLLPGGISVEDYNILYNKIYGESPPAQEIATPTKGDRITVEKDGKRYSLPASQLQQAITQGYKKVG